MKAKAFKTIFASCVGNSVEFYSLTLYGGLVTQMGSIFFPKTEHQMLLSLCVFGCSYIMRPLGGLVLGWFADKSGRAHILSWSILLVGAANFVVVVLPGYASIGSLALWILIFCRLLQGFCVGAEYSGALIFGQEHMRGDQRNAVEGWVSGSCFFGFFLGLVVVHIIDFLPDWGWRLGFALSVVMSIVALCLRRHLGETPEFLQQNKALQKPELKVHELFRVFVLSCMDGVATYTLGIFSLLYLQEYMHVARQTALLSNMFFILLTGFLCVVSARVAYRVSVVKFLRFWLWVGTLILPFCFTWLAESTNLVSISIFLLLQACLAASFVGTVPSVMYSIVPVARRMGTISLAYNAGQAITGGCLSLVMVFLIQKTHMVTMPGHVLSVLYFIFLYAFKRIAKKLKEDNVV